MKHSFFLSILTALIVLTVLTLSACATREPALKSAQMQEDIQKFSESGVGFSEQTLVEDQTLKAWLPYILSPGKDKTQYTLKKYQGKMVIHADASASASGLMVPLKPRSVEGQDLVWEWKALGHLEKADNSKSYTDDAPLRIMLAFDGDKSKLSLRDQMAFELAQMMSGREMPYATLMYVWSGKKYDGLYIANRYTSRLKMIVVDSGSEHVGEWRKHRRNIEKDYKEVFQEEPGKLIGVGILTDTDNTKSFVEAIYGDIEIQRR